MPKKLFIRFQNVIYRTPKEAQKKPQKPAASDSQNVINTI